MKVYDLTREEIARLDEPMKGVSSFQKFINRLQNQINRATATFRLNAEDVNCIQHSAFDYEQGGFQDRLVAIFGRVLGPTLLGASILIAACRAPQAPPPEPVKLQGFLAVRTLAGRQLTPDDERKLFADLINDQAEGDRLVGNLNSALSGLSGRQVDVSDAPAVQFSEPSLNRMVGKYQVTEEDAAKVGAAGVRNRWSIKPSADSSPISFDDYLKLEDGMTLTQAIVVLGRSGEEQSRTAGNIVSYRWSNADGGNLTAGFVGRRLVTKTQTSLH
jgi:hypothetical protein